MLYGVGHCLGRTQSTDASSWLHPPWPAHSSPHSRLHHIPWLTGHDFHHKAGRRHQSASPLAYGASGPDRHCGIGRTRTHHWRYSVSIVWVPHSVPPPPLTAASSVLLSEPRTSGWTPRPIPGGQKPSPNVSNWHPPPKSADHLHLQTRSQDETVHPNHSEQLTVFSWRIFIKPPRFLWYGRPVSWLCCKILLMHPWDTPAS